MCGHGGSLRPFGWGGFDSATLQCRAALQHDHTVRRAGAITPGGHVSTDGTGRATVNVIGRTPASGSGL